MENNSGREKDKLVRENMFLNSECYAYRCVRCKKIYSKVTDMFVGYFDKHGYLPVCNEPSCNLPYPGEPSDDGGLWTKKMVEDEFKRMQKIWDQAPKIIPTESELQQFREIHKDDCRADAKYRIKLRNETRAKCKAEGKCKAKCTPGKTMCDINDCLECCLPF
jgi:hypothetical protein